MRAGSTYGIIRGTRELATGLSFYHERIQEETRKRVLN